MGYFHSLVVNEAVKPKGHFSIRSTVYKTAYESVPNSYLIESL